MVDWASFCREVVYDSMIVRKVMIGGHGHTVEIDESKFGKRKYHRGHRVEGQWVFGGYERETGNCFMVPVENRTAETLLKIIKDWVKPGTTIISDCWKAYNTLNNEGYVHLTVNHRLHFKDPETGVHSNTIEGSWKHAKASLSQYCRKKEFYAGYLANGINDNEYDDNASGGDDDDRDNNDRDSHDSNDDEAPAYSLFL
ncbi:uncharacterized protein LOC111026349 [Myzus persicae]|uniref:uncharacterized protein LOC111026349 n=2 Tax=Myzus persicae TaxID=13164 RepID=UPI000B930032|nr:uncharacterized protein LOC111026349 [Myzus persicae]